MSGTGARRIIVGLSGGVDSAVAALRLLEQGHAVEGLFMKNWEEDDTDAHCSAAEDLAAAEAVAEHLGITLHKVNFSDEYWDRVFEYFLAEYQAGRTPNPDVLCNSEIKFRAFLDHALALGADGIATGHYAHIDRPGDGIRLLKGVDANKDQSYFLHLLTRSQLAHSHFPLGEMHKDKVRERARAAGLPNHARKDSTGICFIGERRFNSFLNQYLPAQPGEIVDDSDRVLGEHQGLLYHTIGQRQGLGIGGRADSSGEPWYVADKDLQHNRLIVVQGGNHPLLLHTGLTLTRLHWINGSAPQQPLECSAKIRYRQNDQPCVLVPLGNDSWQVRFDTPQRAITPGQAVVFYQGEECLGGGTIENRFNP